MLVSVVVLQNTKITLLVDDSINSSKDKINTRTYLGNSTEDISVSLEK